MAKKSSRSHVYAKSTLKEDMNHARWCLIHREYSIAKTTLLKILTNRESDSYRIFYMLGIATFGENDLHAAQKYFLTVLEKEKNHIVSLLYLTVISILHDDRKEGIRYLLEAQSQLKSKTKGKNSKYIKRTLDYIKQYSSDDEKLHHIFENPYRNKILPEFGIIDRRKKIIRNFSILFLLLFLITGGGVYFYFNTLRKFLQPNNARTRTFLEIEENIKKEEEKKLGLDKVRIQLSDREYNKIMSDIKNDFVHYRDNEVWMDANLILYSDRSTAEKNKVQIILQNLKGTSYTSETKWLEYDEIIEETWKYDNVVVKWSGTIAKIEPVTAESKQGRFSSKAQFLVGFLGESAELKASVVLYISNNLNVNNGDKIEILGRVKLVAPEDKNNNNFYLELISYKHLLNTP